MNEYLLLRIVPSHSVFVMAHNIVGCLTTIMLFISSIMFYLRPPIKESREYKITVYFQHSLLFVLCFCWSFIGKLLPELRENFLYSEGYLYFLGISSGEFYSICCFFFGTFGGYLILSFCYRLRMIADQNHFIQNDTFFYGYYIGIMFFYSVLPPIIFYRAFHKDYDLKLHHLNFTNAQIEFFTKAAFTYLPIFSVKCMIYVVYYGMALGGASLMLFALFRSILSEIRKKQLIISAVTINHHRRMFKTLVIQGGLTLGVFVSTPIALYASIFTHVKSIFVEMSLVVFGLGYFVHSSISLFLYDVKRSRTGIKNLFFSFNSHKEKPKSTISRLHG